MREALAALLLRAGLVDEDDAGVEEALLAGDAAEHGVREKCATRRNVGRFRHILLAGGPARPVVTSQSRNSVLSRPSPARCGAAGQHVLRVDRADRPRGRGWSGEPPVDVGFDRMEEDRALEIIGRRPR